MVSTAKANAQADASIKADLMGEVNINFRSETFPLERFADSAAVQLLSRHARWQAPTAPSGGAQDRSEGRGTGAAATEPAEGGAAAAGGGAT